ncbi:MAG: hypothetical protein ACRDVP_11445 [Acidimicrobiales bacterium]
MSGSRVKIEVRSDQHRSELVGTARPGMAASTRRRPGLNSEF